MVVCTWDSPARGMIEGVRVEPESGALELKGANSSFLRVFLIVEAFGILKLASIE